MPFNADTSSPACVELARPSARLLPAPMISNGLRATRASRTAVATSSSVCATTAVIGSKPRQVGKGEPAILHVHMTLLNAGRQSRKHLARIEQAPGVEGAFETLLLVEISLGEHRRHQVAL